MSHHKNTDYTLAIGAAIVALLIAGLVLAQAHGQEVRFYTSSTCAPCQLAKPQMQQLAAEGINVRTISVDRGAPPGITRVPSYEFVDSNGRVLERWVGDAPVWAIRKLWAANHQPQNSALAAANTTSRVGRQVGPLTWSTRNFKVSAPTLSLAADVAEAAEAYYCLHHRDWLGQEARDLAEPCDVTIKLSPANQSATGATSFAYLNGTAFGFSGTWTGRRESLLADVVPHEVMHIVMHKYTGRPFPRWVDEGVASMAESPAGTVDPRQFFAAAIEGGRTIPIPVLVNMTEYPPTGREVGEFYGQSTALVEYLLTHCGGRQKLVEFIAAGGNEPALHTVYRLDCRTLGSRFARWVRSQPLRRARARMTGTSSYEYRPNASICPKCGRQHARTVPGRWVPVEQQAATAPDGMVPLAMSPSTFPDEPAAVAWQPQPQPPINPPAEPPPAQPAPDPEPAPPAPPQSLPPEPTPPLTERLGELHGELGWATVLVGALGLSGPPAVAAVIAAAILRRRIGRRLAGDPREGSPADGFPRLATSNTRTRGAS